MNKIKTLLLGTAALTVAATGAQAADPIFDVKAPREPVYRCDITGFIELPGTDICFKVGGYARLVANAGSKHWAGTAAAINPLPTRTAGGTTVLSYGNLDNGFDMYGQGRLNFDAITATEYGTVRAFIEMQATDNGTNSGGDFGLRHAYVQFGNWTLGKTWSTFYPGFSVGNYTDPYTVAGDNFLRTSQIRYTQAFGGGFTVSLAIENPGFGEDNVAESALFAPFAADPAEGIIVIDDRDEMPVFVAAIGASGDWGQAQLAGLVLRNETRDWTIDPGTSGTIWLPGNTDSEIGWGASFGLALNVPTGEGDTFLFNATYTDGASQYHASSFAGVSGTSTIWGGGVDPYTNSILDSVEAWSVSAAYQHFWTPTVNTSLGGGYTSTDLGSGIPGVFVSPALAIVDVAVTEVTSWDVWANVEWTPVNNLSFILEGRYMSADFEGTDIATGLGADLDEDAFAVTFQATRSF